MKKSIAFLLLIAAASIIAGIRSSTAETKTKSSDGTKVKIVSPEEGETIRGPIMIKAVVNNPAAVHYLDFYFQEAGARDRHGWKDYAPPYFWGGDAQMLDTTLFNDGPASVVAFCHVDRIKKPVSEHRVHVVIDNGKPIVKIVDPENEEEIAGKKVVIVNAQDPKGIREKEGIVAVYIYVDGTNVVKLTREPFKMPLHTCLLTPGRHSIQATAEDTEGFTNSDWIMIKVWDQASVLTKE
jgi:hypothetical protein